MHIYLNVGTSDCKILFIAIVNQTYIRQCLQSLTGLFFAFLNLLVRRGRTQKAIPIDRVRRSVRYYISEKMEAHLLIYG